MKALKFKTNIKCAGCIAAVTPHLDALLGENNWQVDIQNPDKILKVDVDTTSETLIGTLQKAGYKAEKIESN